MKFLRSSIEFYRSSDECRKMFLHSYVCAAFILTYFEVGMTQLVTHESRVQLATSVALTTQKQITDANISYRTCRPDRLDQLAYLHHTKVFVARLLQ